VKRSQRVADAIDAGFTPIGVAAAVAAFRLQHRDRDPGPYHFVDLVAGDRKVQVSISPTGRSVRVFVDGQEAVRDGETGA
jgi:hypothetical protein